jgi:UDP-N-acetylglucosamine--N-acetylmuramyl-(pentapeptide) pyrophosphoryl-undecaprenol N-acetylglucosamine transferase
VALPKEIYPYAQAKTITTGIPISEHFVAVTPERQAAYRKEIDIPVKAKMLFVIGGGLGSQLVNQAVAQAVPHLIAEYPDLYVVHGVGRANLASAEQLYADLTEAQRQRVEVRDFISDVYRYSGAADLVVTRAGATNLAEFAIQGKACIVIPSSFLTGGHQLKNAEYLAEQGAAVVLSEEELAADANRLARQASDLLGEPKHRAELGRAFHTFAKPHATAELAKLLLEVAQ